MQYRVGQVIYVILAKKGQVYPMRIIEEITKKTLRGEEVNYVVQAGASQESNILLNQIEGEIFDTPEEARSILVARATKQIEKLVENAVEKSKEWYGSSAAVDEGTIHELPSPADPGDDSEVVVLPDGTRARLRSAVIG